MRLLHYSLGLPPYRSGGLTKYATDLMNTQSSVGETVSLIYPGDYTFWKTPEIKIKQTNPYEGISIFEIRNPSIVPLLYGVRNPGTITNQKQQLSLYDLEHFFIQVKPEIFHIHTLMGIPSELVFFLKDKGVRIIYTSHDYYGLCLKTNFINRQGLSCDSPNGENCYDCNFSAPTSIFLRMRNSKYILKHKKIISSRHKTLLEEKSFPAKRISINSKLTDDFTTIIEYYKSLFKTIDIFHFNSDLTKSIYEKHLGHIKSAVIPISHSGIHDNRKLKEINNRNVRLAFIGGITPYKGFPLLKKILLKLDSSGINNWTMQVWGNNLEVDPECSRIIFKGKYSSDNIQKIFNEIDLLIVPSIWNETFSLITLEALSFGVPVLASENVGAKDFIKEINPYFVFLPTEERLYNILKNILENTSKIEEYNKQICENPFNYSYNNHIEKMKQFYCENL